MARGIIAALAGLLLLQVAAAADPGLCLTYYPKVKAVSGSYKFQPKFVKSYPDIKTPCPSGYHFATADGEIEIARNIIDAYFVQKVAPVCGGANKAYCCKGGYFYPDGKSVGDLTVASQKATSVSHHYSVTGCFANGMKPGKSYYGYGQGILNYYCGEDRTKTVKQVALIYAKGSFTAE